jgi:hypothetical protein
VDIKKGIIYNYNMAKILYIGDELHRELKMEAVKADRTMRELLEEIIGGWLNGRGKVKADH